MSLGEYRTSIHSVAFRRTRNGFEKYISILEYYLNHNLSCPQNFWVWFWLDMAPSRCSGAEFHDQWYTNGFKLDFIVSVLKIDFMLVITLVISLADRSKGQKDTVVYKITDHGESELHIPFSPGSELEFNFDGSKKFSVKKSRTADSDKSWNVVSFEHFMTSFYYVRDKGKLWCC